MNKFNILLAGLVVFAAVAQLVSANGSGGLANEMAEDEEVDDELEGGFLNEVKSYATKAARGVGVNVEDQYGVDIQNKKVGQATFAEARKQDCSGSSNKKTCRSCCEKTGKSSGFKSRLQSGSLHSTCTCYERDHSYSKQTQFAVPSSSEPEEEEEEEKIPQ